MKPTAIAYGMAALFGIVAPAEAADLNLKSTQDMFSQLSDKLVEQADDFFSIQDRLKFIAYAPQSVGEDKTYTNPTFTRDVKIFADMRPEQSDFIVSTGIHISESKIANSYHMATQAQMSDLGLTAEEVGLNILDKNAQNIAGFAGVGFDNSHTNENWNYKIIAGASFQSDPRISFVTNDQFIDTDPVFLSQLEENRTNLREDLSHFKVATVVHAKMSFRF